MNPSNINTNLPHLCNMAYSHKKNRQISFSTNSKSTYSISSSISSNRSKNLNSIPTFIQLCIYSDENYACRTIRTLLSSHNHYSLNVCDEFGCNALMYSLRYQRYRLFEFLLNELSLDLNFHAKDQQENTILHYAILYGGNDTHILDKLIEIYKKFAIKIDERNSCGFTPLLLAVFCGRYDLVLTLLTKTDASPFVRDYIQLKNMFDYLEIDIKHNEFINRCQKSQRSICSNSELKHLRIQLNQTIPSQRQNSYHMVQHHIYKNFFETILLRPVQDQFQLLRLAIMEMFDFENLSSNLTHLLNYLNKRYPRIKMLRQQKNLQDITKITKLVFQQENSKTNVHNILNLFDPNPRPNITSHKTPAISSSQMNISTTKTPITFKRLSTKITTLTMFSRIQMNRKCSSPLLVNTK